MTVTTQPFSLAGARQEIAGLMAAFRAGDRSAGERLMEIFYPQLKRMAARQMQGERSGHSWQPTMLVNELYLELAQIDALPARSGATQNEQAAFLSLAGKIMRRLLIRRARSSASKAQKVQVTDVFCACDNDAAEIEQLLERLEAIKPGVRAVVEMKVFGGMTSEEIAAQLGCATVTVNRYWQFARHWLRRELGETFA